MHRVTRVESDLQNLRRLHSALATNQHLHLAPAHVVVTSKVLQCWRVFFQQLAALWKPGFGVWRSEVVRVLAVVPRRRQSATRVSEQRHNTRSVRSVKAVIGTQRTVAIERATVRHLVYN